MKKIVTPLLLLAASALLIGCSDSAQDTQEQDGVGQEVAASDTEQAAFEQTTEMEIAEPSLPPFDTVAKPEVALLSAEGIVKIEAFDHSYTEACWNDCETEKLAAYNYPDVHSGVAEVGDRLRVNWQDIEPKPSEVYFIHVHGNEPTGLTEKSRVQIDTEISSYEMAVEEDPKGDQFAIEFVWKEDEAVAGKSFLDFEFK